MVPFFRSNRRRKSARPINWSSLVLEPRILPSAIQVIMSNDADGAVDLKIKGTAEADTILFTSTNDGQTQIELSVNGIQQAPPIVVGKLDDVSADLGAGFDSLMILDGVVMDDLYVKDGTNFQDGGFHSIRAGSNSVRMGDVRFDILNGSVPVYLESNSSLALQSLSFNFANTAYTSINISTGGEGSSLVVEKAFSVKSRSSSSLDRIEVVNNGFANNRIEFRGGVNLALGGSGSSVTFSMGLSGKMDIDGNVIISTATGDGFFTASGDITVHGNVRARISHVNVTGQGTFEGNVVIVAAAGPAFVTLSGGPLNRIVVGKNLSVDTGNSNDSILLQSVLVSGNLKVNTGQSVSNPAQEGTAATDSLSIVHSEILRRTRIVAKGAAIVRLAATDAQLPAARFRGAVEIRIGSGSINVESIDDPAAALIFDGRQEFVGTSSPIVVKYDSGVIFRLALRRLVNAVLG